MTEPIRDHESERALLGIAIVDPDVLDIPSVRTVRQSDFFEIANGKLWAMLLNMRDAGTPIGGQSIIGELRKANSREWDGQALSNLIGEGWDVQRSSVKWFAACVLEKSRLRAMEDIAHEMSRKVVDVYADAERVSAWCVSKLESLGDCRSTPARRIGSLVSEVLDDIEAKAGTSVRGVPTGLPTVDTQMGRLMPGELIVVAARPSNGKTSLVMQMAKHAAGGGAPTLVVSLEMAGTELAQRSLCAAAEVNQRTIRNGSVGNEDRRKLIEMGAELYNSPLEIWAPPRATMGDIRGVARTAKRTEGLSLLVVDYIGLVKPTDPKRPRHEQIGAVTADLKALAKELEVPVVAACQLNRSAEGQTPSLAMLRDSGSVEQDADIVVFLHRDDRQQEQVEFHIAKHRNGQTGRLMLRFDSRLTTFVDQQFESMRVEEFDQWNE